MNCYLLISLGLNICLILLLGLAWNRCRRHKEAQKKLVTIASHELKTPLTIIKGYTDFLNDGTFGKLEKKQAHCCQKINKISQQGLSLIEKILMHQQKCAFKPVNIKLIPFMSEISDQLEGLCLPKNLNIQIESSVKSPVARFDKDQLSIVVRNLLTNALKFSKKNQSVIIDIKPAADQQWMEISLTNIGDKIPETDRNQIFKPWYTTDKNGSGLGLSIAKEIIESQGGKCWLDHSNTTRTTFIFTVPAKA